MIRDAGSSFIADVNLASGNQLQSFKRLEGSFNPILPRIQIIGPWVYELISCFLTKLKVYL